MKCVDCGSEQDGNLVHSGVDAFVLGVIDLVGRICYECARLRKTDEQDQSSMATARYVENS